MHALRSLILWLAFVLACFLPAAALTPVAPENRVWEISSIGYDAAASGATDFESRTETSTSNYDTAPIHREITEEIPTEGNCVLFGPNAKFKAAEDAEYQAYKDSLRAQMSRPAATDAKLNSLLDDLYRPNAQIAPGSTAAAVRAEAATGDATGGLYHTQKAQQYSKALQDWLNKNPTASPGDRAAAENVLRDMQNALNGN